MSRDQMRVWLPSTFEEVERNSVCRMCGDAFVTPEELVRHVQRCLGDGGEERIRALAENQTAFLLPNWRDEEFETWAKRVARERPETDREFMARYHRERR